MNIQYSIIRHHLCLREQVNEEKIRKHGFPPSENMKVIVCGLPGVYDKLCGSRESSEVAVDSVLSKLGYSSSMVIKL